MDTDDEMEYRDKPLGDLQKAAQVHGDPKYIKAPESFPARTVGGVLGLALAVLFAGFGLAVMLHELRETLSG